MAEPRIEDLITEEHETASRRENGQRHYPPLTNLRREFTSITEDRYRLSVPDLGIALEVDRLRRDHHELIGELSVWCDLPGARTVDGTLSVADFNLSSSRARQERANLLTKRASMGQFDWVAVVEEFCQRVLRADRAGQPAVDLRHVPPAVDDNVNFEVEGLVVPRRHPTILFGDGGTGKSYIGLYLAGRLAENGLSVAFFDWELGPEDHQDRLQRLFPDGMPQIWYARCDRPLTYETDRLRRIAREHRIDYAIYDSVGNACDGPPESAEAAVRYIRAVRQIGGGSLHVAHITKGENGDKKPFGSVFFHNGARSTWYAKSEGEEGSDSGVLKVGLFNRKVNLGRLNPPVGYSITFADDRTTIRRTNVADSRELAGQLSIRQRMEHLLRRGAMTVAQIAEELEVEVNSVTQTVNRCIKKSRPFIVLEGTNTDRRIGLADRDSAEPEWS